MSDSMGSIYQRSSDGRWVGKYSYIDPLTGEKETKYVYSSKPGRKGEQEVKRKLNDFIKKIESGNLSDVYKITVGGWLKKFLEVYCADLSPTTLDTYKMYIEKHIVPQIGNLLLRDLKPIHIQNFYNHERKNGFSEKTILQEHRILHRAFKKAMADGLIAKNPCDAVDAPSPKEYQPTIYTEEEFLLLLDKIKGHKLEPIVLLAGMCGLRRGELLGLTWQDLDLENGVLNISKSIVATSEGNINKKPKSKNSVRRIAIPSAIIPRLKELRGIGKIISKEDGGEYDPRSISRMFNEFLKKNNLKHIRLHDLRHFNATMMLKHNISDKEAAKRLGHSDPSVTRKIYQHVLEDMDRASAEKLNNILKGSDELIEFRKQN